jgi:O-antigen/teichoic acid export membrane protein
MMRRRVLAGIGANSIGMAVSIGIQLISLPLFLHYWDAETYGVWLMLSAIPAYLSMADVGMVTAVGNKMTIAMGAGDHARANRVFQSAQLFMTVVCGAIALVVIPVVLLAPLPWVQNVDQRLALMALSAGVLIALFGGLSEAIFKSTQRYPFGTLVSNIVRLGEWLGSMVGLILFGSFAAVAFGGLLVRFIGTVVTAMLASGGKHDIHWGTKAAAKQEIREMVKPAASFMAFPLANALSFQGMTLLVGAFFGPASVAIFNTYRTIARLAVQVTAIFSHALWPEFSRLFGLGGAAAVQPIYQRSMLMGLLQSFVFSFVLYFVSPFLLQIWTHGAIAFLPTLMVLMLLYAAIGGVWHIPRVFLMATNQHTDLAYWSLVAGTLSVGLAWLIGIRYDLQGAVIAMLMSEVFIAVVCALLARRALKQQLDNKAPAYKAVIK